MHNTSQITIVGAKANAILERGMLRCDEMCFTGLALLKQVSNLLLLFFPHFAFEAIDLLVVVLSQPPDLFVALVYLGTRSLLELLQLVGHALQTQAAQANGWIAQPSHQPKDTSTRSRRHENEEEQKSCEGNVPKLIACPFQVGSFSSPTQPSSAELPRRPT